MSRKTLLGLCKWSKDHRGEHRSYVDPERVREFMPVDGWAHLVWWCPEGFDQDSHQWVMAGWEVPGDTGLAGARFYMLAGRLRQLLHEQRKGLACSPAEAYSGA